MCAESQKAVKDVSVILWLAMESSLLGEMIVSVKERTECFLTGGSPVHVAWTSHRDCNVTNYVKENLDDLQELISITVACYWL